MEVYHMVAVGTEAPDFELSDDSGQAVRLSHFRGKKVILYFYPKALTKG
jgi:peroxiredoxin Q/BCP